MEPAEFPAQKIPEARVNEFQEGILMTVFNKKKDIEIQTQIASVALAIEALEQKLIKAGILQENELMEYLSVLAQEKMSPQAMQ